MHVKPNPIEEWLARVAIECGSPEKMVAAVGTLRADNHNTEQLILAYAVKWKAYPNVGYMARVMVKTKT